MRGNTAPRAPQLSFLTGLVISRCIASVKKVYVFLFSKSVLKTSRKRGCGVFPASVAGHACSRVGWGGDAAGSLKTGIPEKERKRIGEGASNS